MHITILQTDSVMAQFQAEFGDYPGMFEQNIAQVAAEQNLPLTMTSWDVRERLPDDAARDQSDAYLITGSRHSVYDDLPWIEKLATFLRAEISAGKKVVGVCFGHQLMAHFFGGHVGPAEGGWAVGAHTSKVHTHEPWMDQAADSLALISSHKDQVLKLPENAQPYLSNSFCPIAGFTLGDQVITVQGHPEFSSGYSQALMNYRRDILGEETFNAGIASLDTPLDASRWIGWMLSFLHNANTAQSQTQVQDRTTAI
ncbi:MAG: GMP synthase [Pseudomonadota bacterium]